MLTLTDVQKQFAAPGGGAPTTIIDVPHFVAARGEEMALTGSSGSGKTTLLHLIAGILTPDRGTIVFDLRPPGAPDEPAPAGAPAHSGATLDAHVDLTQLSEARRDHFRGQHIGYIFQTHHLLPGFTALENVLLGMTFTGRTPDHAWAKHLLERVGLADRLHYRPAKLSLGQQQRVAVARALASRPALVLADEPTGALDVTNAQQVLDLIRELCREVHATLLLVTHDRQIAAQLPRLVELHDINRAVRRPVAQGAA